MNILVLDTETTGLNKEQDEILQLSMVDGRGYTVFNRYIRPTRKTSWEDAAAINGITPEMVAEKHTIDHYLPALQKFIDEADVIVGYNVQFDIKFLEAAGLRVNCKVVDIMLPFATIFGKWNGFYHNFRWQKLTTCAEFYGYDWGKDMAHDSLADCRATLYCYKEMSKRDHLCYDDKGNRITA